MKGKSVGILSQNMLLTLGKKNDSDGMLSEWLKGKKTWPTPLPTFFLIFSSILFLFVFCLFDFVHFILFISIYINIYCISFSF